jgi:hypothetical protein
MSDFYSDPAAKVLIQKYGPPSRITIGEDGIPDYVTATTGSRYQYIPEPGYRLAICHNGVRIKHIVEADRKRGWALGLHYRENADWTVTHELRDKDGVAQHRFYQGEITFHLIYAAGIYTPPELRGTHRSLGGVKVFGFYEGG